MCFSPCLFFRTMARSLNSQCDFWDGFFSCDLPVDTVQLVVHIETKHRKHTLKEDKEKRTEKYRPGTRRTDNDDLRWVLESLNPSISSDSGAWTPTHGFDYKPKLFEDPRNSQSSKENIPPLEPIPIPVLNIEEVDFLNRMDRLLGNDYK